MDKTTHKDLQRLSQSALELSLDSFEAENNIQTVKDLPPSSSADVPVAVALTSSSSSISPVQSCCGQSTNLGSFSPKPSRNIRSFLTPPLMRKRKENVSNLGDSRESMSQLSTSLPSSASKSRSSLGLIGLLKSKFGDKSKVKHPVAVPTELASSSSVDVTAPFLFVEKTEHQRHSHFDLTFNGTDHDQHSSESIPIIVPANILETRASLSTSIVATVDEKDESTVVSNFTQLSETATTKNFTVPSRDGKSRVPIPTRTWNSLDQSALGNNNQSTVTLRNSDNINENPSTTNTLKTLVLQGSIPHNGPLRLHVTLKQGRNLAAKDSNGTSDPYVKFKLGNKVVARSKTIYRDLNPVWDEKFQFTIDDLTQPLQIRVFDYDWGQKDDFLGASLLDLTSLQLSRVTLASVELYSDAVDGCQGIIDLSVALYPKLVGDELENKTHSSVKQEQTRKIKFQNYSSIVNIIVIEGKNLADKEEEPLSKPFLRLRLGNEKYKTKFVTRTSNTVTWLEQFDFHPLEDTSDAASNTLEITLHEKGSGKDDTIARSVLDLTNMEKEKTHSVNTEFAHGGSGELSLLVTISGTINASETISDLSATLSPTQTKELEAIKNRYKLFKTFKNVRDVGHLTVKVFKATGLASADLGGKSDPFCVLQLVNSRLQTQTEYKTLNPTWNKLFTFNIKDINSVLEVSVYDEDRDYKFEFLGTVSIPLLRICNGQKKWYHLKDRKLRSRAKGESAQILMELSIVWNEIRAGIQTLQPKENKYIEPEMKFSRQKFVRNVIRIKAVLVDVIEMMKYIESCWEWESPFRSCVAFALFLVITWYFEPWVFPLGFLLFFFRNFLIQSFSNPHSNENDSEVSNDDDEDDGDNPNKEERKSLKERLQAIQEVTFTVQKAVGYIASSVESVKNTFNFSVPFLSYLAIILLLVASLLLYAIPLRYIILAWGTNKFTRKLLRPHSIDNNELLDFLSRVPDDEQLLDYRELRADTSSTADQHGDKSNHRTSRKK